MISARQRRAARALRGWSQQDLAERAIVSVNALPRLEGEQVDPRLSTVAAVKSSLENAGIDVLAADGRQGEGVRLRLP